MKIEIKNSIEKLREKNLHFFNIEIATKIGIEKAILLQNFQFWLEKNKANKAHIHKGKNGKTYYWTFNSRNAYSILFPYLKERTIGRYLQELENDGVLLSDNFNKRKYDRTKWYTIPLLYESQLPKTANALLKMTNGCSENGQPIPDRNTDKKPSMQSNDCEPFSSSPERKKTKKEPYNFKRQLAKMFKDPKRHIQIIALWIQEKHYQPQTSDQLNSLIKRNLRAAALLKGYQDKTIITTIKKLKGLDYLEKFSLETVAKYIDEEVTQEEQPEKEVVKYEKNYDKEGNVASISPVYKENIE